MYIDVAEKFTRHSPQDLETGSYHTNGCDCWGGWRVIRKKENELLQCVLCIGTYLKYLNSQPVHRLNENSADL